MRLHRIKIVEGLSLVEGAFYLARRDRELFVAKGMFVGPGNMLGVKKPGWFLQDKQGFWMPSQLDELYRIANTGIEA